MVNLGGYDNNSFYDSNGVTYLKHFLQKNHSIKAMIESDDKIPNLDGTIQLLDNNSNSKIIPIQIFHIQVKTLNDDYKNTNVKGEISQYKYSVDTKVFNVVKKYITCDPVLLFLVDEINKKIFWFYISIEYVMKLDIDKEKKKTIYFNDSNMIINLNEFQQKLFDIHKKKVKLNYDGYENIITTNYDKNTKAYELLQLEWDYLDFMLNNKFKIATNYMYPDVWKFGLAYQEGAEFNTIGIYQIKKGVNDVFIKKFDTNNESCFTVSLYNKDKTNIRAVLNRQIGMLANKFYKSGSIPASCLSDLVLEEISFYFLDLIANSCGKFEHHCFTLVYYKTWEKVSEIRKIWNALISFAIKENEDIIKLHADVPNVKTEINPFGSLLSYKVQTKKEAEKKFLEILENINDNINVLPYPLKFSNKYCYQLFADTICELEERKIEIINRPWNPKKYKLISNENKHINEFKNETNYLIEDIYFNNEKILNKISSAYKFSVKKIWKDLSVNHTIRKEYSIIFDKNDISGTYYIIIRDSYDFNVIINEYLVEELNPFESDFINKYHTKSIIRSNFYLCSKIEMPLYYNIWYLLNMEMWDDNITKPSIGIEYILNN